MTHQTETLRFAQKKPLSTLRRLIATLWGLGLYISMFSLASADECTVPDSANWVVDLSCEISTIQISPRSLSVINGAILTVENSGELILDMRNFRINVDPDSRIIVEDGGRIRSNQIGPRLVRRTDDGTFGYFLKRVGGSVLDTINPDLSFHPSSTIKTLYLIEALRQVNAGTLNLAAASLTSCPGTTFTLGGTLSCPGTSFTASTNGSGSCASPPVANTQTNCGAPTVAYRLRLGICAMMKVSHNQATNAIQEV
ncbi:hypothetical protein MNBD_GAMMA17-176, partial [hydrothermal vent metagenome]